MTIMSTTHIVIVFEELIKQVDGLWADEMLVFRVDEALPSFLRVPGSKCANVLSSGASVCVRECVCVRERVCVCV